jgi:hypothetical protein
VTPPAAPATAPAGALAAARTFAVKVMGGASLQAVTAVVYGVATLLVARHVGPSVFGQLAVGTIIALVGADVLDLGRNSLLVRMQAQGLVPTRELSRRLIRAKLTWSPVLLAALLAASLVMTHRVHLYLLLFFVYGISYTVWQTLVTPFRGEAELWKVSSCAAQERLITAPRPSRWAWLWAVSRSAPASPGHRSGRVRRRCRCASSPGRPGRSRWCP